MISIVVATWARLPHLQRCLAQVRNQLTTPYELVVVGAGDGDGTESWVLQQPDVRFIPETRREGATRAYNKGLRAARGEFVMWLNDDSWPLPGAVEAAARFLAQPEAADVGLAAFYHNFPVERNRLDSVVRDGETYSIYHVRGTPYANFGLLRRALLERLGWLDERYYFCAWDPDLSLKVQRLAGLRVVGCRAALVHHDELLDARKRADLAVFERDNAQLYAKWGLPGPGEYADPRPAYRELLRARGWDVPAPAAPAAETPASIGVASGANR